MVYSTKTFQCLMDPFNIFPKRIRCNDRSTVNEKHISWNISVCLDAMINKTGTLVGNYNLKIKFINYRLNCLRMKLVKPGSREFSNRRIQGPSQIFYIY